MLYQWTSTTSPRVTMTTPAAPKVFRLSRESEVNGAVSAWSFSVRTTNYLQDGDRIAVKLPYPAFLSETSACFGESSNLRSEQPCTVSTDLTHVTITLSLPSRRRELSDDDFVLEEHRRLARSRTIASGELSLIHI